MSLKTFHLIFILLAMIGAEMFGAWALWHYPVDHDRSLLWLGIVGLVGGLLLAVYALFFVRKADAEHLP